MTSVAVILAALDSVNDYYLKAIAQIREILRRDDAHKHTIVVPRAFRTADGPVVIQFTCDGKLVLRHITKPGVYRMAVMDGDNDVVLSELESFTKVALRGKPVSHVSHLSTFTNMSPSDMLQVLVAVSLQIPSWFTWSYYSNEVYPKPEMLHAPLEMLRVAIKYMRDIVIPREPIAPTDSAKLAAAGMFTHVHDIYTENGSRCSFLPYVVGADGSIIDHSNADELPLLEMYTALVALFVQLPASLDGMSTRQMALAISHVRSEYLAKM
jgi:hypothetical protein